MPLPPAIGQFNRRVTNRLTAPLVGRVRAFARVEHRGRRSGAVYQTPILLFHDGPDLVIALTYGPGTDWVKNILAAGSGVVIEKNRRIPAANPRLESGPAAMAPLPRIVRTFLGLTGVTETLRLTPAPPTETAPGNSP